MAYRYTETFEDGNIVFNNISQPNIQTGNRIASGAYTVDDDGNITKTRQVVQAIDIDWLRAQIPGVEGEIRTTGQLLHLIGQMKDAIEHNSNVPDDLLERLNTIESNILSLQDAQFYSDGQRVQEYLNRFNAISTEFSNVQQEFRDHKIAINAYSAKVDALDKIKNKVVTKEQFDRMTSMDPDTLYFVIGEPDYYVIVSEGEQESESLETFKTSLTVNGNTVTPVNGVVTLVPSIETHVFKISGKLNGRLVVDVSGLSVDDSRPGEDDSEMDKIGNTEIILNNVIISSPTDKAISYVTPEDNKGYKGLMINLAPNSTNIIYARQENEVEDSQNGAIDSDNNLFINGVGYLIVKSNGGHGIKATELSTAGPHIYVHATHDCMHGKHVNINSGVYYFDNGVDGIGSTNKVNETTNEPIKGDINIFSGTFYGTDGLSGNLIDSKAPGVYTAASKFMGPNDSLSGISLLSSASVGTGVIKAFTSSDNLKNNVGGNTLELDSNNCYTYSLQNNSNYLYIYLKGYINHPIILDGDLSSTDFGVNIYLDNAFIHNDGNSNYEGWTNTNPPCIYFKNKKGRVKIFAMADTKNYIINDFINNSLSADLVETDCIKSENNIEFELKNNSFTYISSKQGDGVDGGEVRMTDSKGNIIISNCGQRGIKGNAIVIGPTATISDSVISSYITDPDAVDDNEKSIYTSFDGTATIKDNCKKYNKSAGSTNSKVTGFADIYARNGKHNGKGSFGTSHNEIKGALILGSIGAVVKIDFAHSDHIYYNEVVTSNIELVNMPDPVADSVYAYDINKNSIIVQ